MLRKRIVSALLVVCMLLMYLPVTAFAETTTVDSGTCGSNLTWELDSEGTLTVSGTGEMWSSPNWKNDYANEIKTVVIEDGVTSIGGNAFYNCSSLTGITIPDGVTSIGNAAFSGCSSLTGITIPDGVTSIGNSAFDGCIRLISITIPDSVTSIDSFAFEDCTSLTSITIPDGVTSIGEDTFYGCSSLTSISIPDSVTSIGNAAFYCCSSLTSITIPDGVTSIGNHVFNGCESLTSITIPDSVTSIGYYSFNACTNLAKIVFLGDAPEFIDTSCFTNVTATAYYPSNNDTWTEDVMQDYGGNITWVSNESDVESPVEGPVESISVEDIEVIENIDGYWYNDWDEEAEEEVTWYRYDIEPEIVTVTYKDGTVISDTPWAIYEQTGYWPYCSSDQSYENQWGLGEHTVTVELMGVTAEYTVTVVENPIESISVEDIEVIEKYDGYWENSYWDEDTGEWIEDAWYCYDIGPKIVTVTYKDGTVISGDSWEIYDQTGYWLSWSSNQAYENQWGVGDHTVTVELMGVTAEYTVTVVENPIESISVEDIEATEKCDGYWENGYWDEETGEWIEDTWYQYDIEPEIVTVTYKDGTVISGDRWEIYDQTGYWPSCSSDQSHENQWGLGEHTVTVELMGITAEYTVTVVESPVESIRVEDIEVTEKCDGYWDGYWDEETGEWIEHTWYWYNVEPEIVTVTYKDGTVISGAPWEIEDQTGYWPSWSSDQSYENQWGLGEHTATVELMGVTAEYTVTVVESPVESVRVDNIEIIENIDGYWYDNWDEETEEEVTWYRYNIEPKIITVTYKDGTVISGDYWEIYDQTGYWPSCSSDQSYENQWGLGEHTATVELMGITAEYTVIVVETPVSNIEIVQNPTKREYLQGEVPDLRGTVLRITYKDGAQEDIALDWTVGNIYKDFGYYSDYLGRNYSVDVDTWLLNEIGTQNIEFEFLGERLSCPVTVSENDTESISIRNGENKELILTLNHSDGTASDLKVLDFAYVSYSRGGGDGLQYIVTDQGALEGWGNYDSDTGSLNLTIRNATTGGYLTSNTLENCEWYEVRRNLDSIIGSIHFRSGDTKAFDGTITSENIHDILAIAVTRYYFDNGEGGSLFESEYLVARDRNSITMTVEGLEIMMRYTFGVIPDFSLSDTYDAAAGTVKIPYSDAGGGGQVRRDLEYVDGYWNIAERRLYGLDDLYLKLDDDLHIVSYNYGGETSATDHSYGEWTETKAATCTEAGEKRRDCENCDHYETEVIPAKGHSYEAVVTKPTAAEQGYTTYTCSICNDTYIDDYVDALGVQITKQPTSITVAEGETAKVTVTAQGSGLTYKWYYKNAGATKFSYTSSFAGDTYSVTMDSTRADRQVYCVITDQYGNSVTTNTVTLGMQTPLKITKQPTSVTVAEGTTAKVTVTAQGDGLTYKWYFKNAGDADFSYTSSVTGSSYSTKMNSTRADRQIYCVITDQYGNSVTTNTVTLGMQTPLKITEQPTSVAVVEGETAAVTVTAQGDGLTYKWYYKNAGASKFSYTSSFAGDTYSVTMDSTRADRQIYCVITDQYGNSVTTNTVTLGMQTPLKITKQPASVKVANGATAKVTVTAQGDGLTYKWYYKNANATDFSYTSSFKGNTYSVTMDSTRADRQIYCVITDQYGNSVTTNTVTLGMQTPLKITTQPASVTVAEGEIATVTVAAQGDGLTYKWYYKNASATKFSYTSSFAGDTYSVEMDSTRADRQIYCVITDQYGNTVTTNTVRLRMVQ